MSDTDNAPVVTDQEVAEARETVQERREELARLTGAISTNEDSRNNAVRKARLDREAESLEQQIENARRRLEISQGVDHDAPKSGDNKDAWVEYARDNDIDTTGMTKAEVQEAVEAHAGTAGLPSQVRTEANVIQETGEVNPEEVERLTDTSYSDED